MATSVFRLALLVAVGWATLLHAQAPGIRWQRVTNIYGSDVYEIAMTSDGALHAATRKGMYTLRAGNVLWGLPETPNLFPIQLATSGRTIFAGTNAGLYRSDNGGAEWTLMDVPNTRVSDVVVDGNTVYGCAFILPTERGAFRSDDLGATWEFIGISPRSVRSLLPWNGLLFAATDGGIFRSKDRGRQWERLNVNLRAGWTWGLCRNRDSLFAVARENGVIRSDDGGDTWQEIGLMDVEVLTAFHGRLFAGKQDGLLQSNDNGRTWVASAFPTLWVQAITSVGDQLYISAYGGVFVSDDWGDSWKDISAGMADHHVLSLARSGKRLYVGTGSGVFSALDDGTAWTRTSFVYATAVLTADADTVYAMTYGRGIFRSDDAGRTWKEINNGVAFDMLDGRKYYRGDPRTLIVTEDGLYASFYHGGFLHSTDRGETWRQIGMRFYQPGDGPLAFGIYDGWMYVNSHAYAARSPDAGTTWEPIPTGLRIPVLGPFRGNEFVAFDGKWLLIGEVGVLRLDEVSLSWLNISQGLPVDDPSQRLDARCAAIVGKSLYIGTHYGVYRLFAGRDEWVPAGLEGHVVQALLAHDGILYVGTGDGLYRATIDQNVSVEPRGKQALSWGRIKGKMLPPERTALLPNYPNPFNPETWIPFQLREDVAVTLTLYDAHGNTVRRLDLGRRAAGIYATRDSAAYWDGRNDAGERAASGVYLCELSAGTFRAARRLVLAK